MDLEGIISKNPHPITLPHLKAGLEELGLHAGSIVLCHSSLSAFGWVNGGSQTIILALEAAIGKRGTLVMPTQTWGFSNPVLWIDPPVPAAWWEEICDTMPAFDPDLSPCLEMGIIPETFRKQKGAIRSWHPQTSFTARGPKARSITRKHSLDFGLGDHSPLGRLYDMNALILLLGCGWQSCTAFHLAEHRSDWSWKAELSEYAPVKKLGWTKIRNWNNSSDDFEACGNDFEKANANQIQKAMIGKADCRLIRFQPLVDFAIDWFSNNRTER